MHIKQCQLLLSLSLLTLAACDLKPEVVGATLSGANAEESVGEVSTSGDTGDAGDAGPSTVTVSTADTSPTTGPADDGAPCELAPENIEEGQPGCPGVDCPSQPDYSGGPIVATDLACAGEICVFAGEVESKQCDVPEDCASDERFYDCVEGMCVVEAAWGEAHTGCTRTCELATDCPALPGCAAGPVCTAVALIGSLCCEKVCACGDELSESWLADRELACASGKYCQ